jgi:hypothetical protein
MPGLHIVDCGARRRSQGRCAVPLVFALTVERLPVVAGLTERCF